MDKLNSTDIQNNEKLSKEETILKAALKAYFAYGMNEATTRQIADIAGIGKSTIYEYFKSKEELLNASFSYLLNGMKKGHNKIHSMVESDPLSAMNFYLDNAINTAINDPSTLLLISQYSLGILLKTNRLEIAKSEYREKMHPVMQSLIDEFRFIISNGIEKNVFHPEAGLSTDGLVYTVCALIREIQAQAFLQDKDELSRTCSVIKDTVYKLLGVNVK